MGYVKIWIHIVWTTKNRKTILDKERLVQIINHIKTNAKEKRIHVDSINGYLDHLHVLISLRSTQTIDKVMMQLKGESSHWINKNKLYSQRFQWQTEYFAVSMCESSLPHIRKYIRNQATHHKRKTFEDEYRDFMKKYGFDSNL